MMPTGADDGYDRGYGYDVYTSKSSCCIFVISCFLDILLIGSTSICYTLLTCATMALTLSAPPPASAAWMSAWAVCDGVGMGVVMMAAICWSRTISQSPSEHKSRLSPAAGGTREASTST